MSKILKLCFYVPESHLEVVKEAVFLAGAGRYKNYDKCCWATLGVGQFRPLSSSKPYIGKENEVEQVPEYKVEMICEERFIRNAIEALKASDPYEEVAFEYFRIDTE